MVKHTLKILQCLQLENFYSMFKHFSLLPIKPCSDERQNGFKLFDTKTK